jgi:hypothetical protein
MRNNGVILILRIHLRKVEQNDGRMFRQRKNNCARIRDWDKKKMKRKGAEGAKIRKEKMGDVGTHGCASEKIEPRKHERHEKR